MKQLRIRLFDVMAEWNVFMLCPMGFQCGNLLHSRSTVILQKQLGINLGRELGEDFQEAVQGDSGTGCQIRKLDSKYGTSFKMKVGEFMEEVL